VEIFCAILFWFCMIVIGRIISHAKGRGSAGFWLAFLLGPLGVLIILAMTNLKKEEEEKSKKFQAARQMQLQQAQLRSMENLNMMAMAPPPQREVSKNLRIASGGVDLGEMPAATVKAMIQNGKLSLQDHYFDRDANEWMPLDCCVAIS